MLRQLRAGYDQRPHSASPRASRARDASRPGTVRIASPMSADRLAAVGRRGGVGRRGVAARRRAVAGGGGSGRLGLIRTWIEQARADRTKGRTGLTSEEREELRRLRKENRTLRTEREILKKAAAFFAKDHV